MSHSISVTKLKTILLALAAILSFHFVFGLSNSSAQQPIKLTPLDGKMGELLPTYSRERLLLDLGTKMSLGAFANAHGDQKFADANLKKAGVIMDALLLRRTFLGKYPPRQGDTVKDTADALGYLISKRGNGRKVGAHIRSRYGEREAAYFELGLKTMIAAKLYVKNGDVKTNGASAAAVERSAKTAGIPKSYSENLVAKLRNGKVDQPQILKEISRFQNDLHAALKIRK